MITDVLMSQDKRLINKRIHDDYYDDSPLDKFNPEQAAKRKRQLEEIMREKRFYTLLWTIC